MSRFSRVRVVVSVALCAAILLALAGLQRRSWNTLAALQRDFQDVQLETFRLADHIRAQMWQLREALVNYRLNPQPAERARAEKLVRDLQSWLGEWKWRPRTANERHLAAQVEAAYLTCAASIQAYLTNRIEAGKEITNAEAVDLFKRLQAEAIDLLAMTARLESAQRRSADSVAARLQDELTSYQLAVSAKSMLFALLGAALLATIYLGLIAPLRETVRRSRVVLERQEKLAALSTLVAGLAHEIRNPLNSIKARLFTQAQDLPEASEALQDNQFITDEIGRLDKVIKDFLLFARPGDPSLEVFSAAQPFRDLAELMQAGLAKNQIRLETDFAAEPLIRADRQQLKQALLNLAKNAAEAVGQDGTIRFQTRLAASGRKRQGRLEAVLEVADTGPGIPPGVQARLFDPFFTTKPAGTGLGLSITARIVEKHGGHLEYRTRLGLGSTFSVVLPTVDPHELPTHSSH